MGVEVVVFADNKTLSESLGKFVKEVSSHFISSQGFFSVALSGGSLPSLLSNGLLPLYKQQQQQQQQQQLQLKEKEEEDYQVEYNKWKVFFADERYVPLDDPQSNYGLCKKELFDPLPFDKEKIFPVNTSLSSLEEAAADYEKVIQRELKDAQFDLLLLGMGPDGHTCSLFPLHPLVLNPTERLVDSLNDSPKPPPPRVTITQKVIEKAKLIVYVIKGEEKAEALKDIFEVEDVGIDKRPAKIPNLFSTGHVLWILDAPAASSLTKTNKLSVIPQSYFTLK